MRINNYDAPTIMNIVRLGRENSVIKKENIVRLSRKIVSQKNANKQQNSANKHPEHCFRTKINNLPFPSFTLILCTFAYNFFLPSAVSTSSPISPSFFNVALI